MNIRIAICDDIKEFTKHTKELVEEYAGMHQLEMESFCFTDPQKLIRYLAPNRFHLYLLDVEMPGIDGITLSRKILEEDEEALFIFITSHPQFAYDAFQISAVGYLSKPLYQEQFKRIMDRAVLLLKGRMREKELESQYLEVTHQYFEELIYIKNIAVIDKYVNHVFIITRDGKEYQCRSSFKKIEHKFDKRRFLKISLNCIINIYAVKEVKDGAVTLRAGEKEIARPVKKGIYQEVKRQLEQFLSRRAT